MASQEMAVAVVKSICQEPTLLLCDQRDCEFCTEYCQPTADHVRWNRFHI